jgi:hypothetical protein
MHIGAIVMSGECSICGKYTLKCSCGRQSFKSLGSAPIIFTDEKKRKEWEDLSPGIKKSVMSRLHSMADQMETKLSIEMLCNIIVDMDKRIRDLEEKNHNG